MLRLMSSVIVLVVWFSDSAQHSALLQVVGIQDVAIRRVVSEANAALSSLGFGLDGLAQRCVIDLDGSAVSLVIGCLHH